MDPADFRKRQEADHLRQRNNASSSGLNVQRRQPFHMRYDDRGQQIHDAYIDDHSRQGSSDDEGEDRIANGDGEEGWRNSEGERLADFGVEEDVEFYDEDVPLAELIKAKRMQQASSTGYAQ